MPNRTNTTNRLEMTTLSSPKVDVRALVDLLGGPARCRQVMGEQGLPVPEYMTLLQWTSRYSIPGHWLLCLLIAANRAGYIVDLGEMLVTPEDVLA